MHQKLSLSTLLTVFVLFNFGCAKKSELSLGEPNQQKLDAALSDTFDIQITKDIISEYYSHTQNPDNIYCAHQQAYIEEKLFSSDLTVYAKVTCAESSPGFGADDDMLASDLASDLGALYKDLSNLTAAPLKIIIQPSADSFSVLSWEFPRSMPFYAKDQSQMFSSKAHDKIMSLRTGKGIYDSIRGQASKY